MFQVVVLIYLQVVAILANNNETKVSESTLVFSTKQAKNSISAAQKA